MALVPERPRSSSITSTRPTGQPSPTARSARPYRSRVDSVWSATCCTVDWRTYTTASRSQCRGPTLPERTSHGRTVGSTGIAVIASPLAPRPHRGQLAFHQRPQQPDHQAAIQLR
jgi:hypothetical protein